MLHHLRSLISKSNKCYTNLTGQYYGCKVARHLIHRLLVPQVKELMHEEESIENAEQQLQEQYEKVLIVIAQWCQPHLQVDPEKIRQSFDDMAEATFQRLKDLNAVDANTIKSLADFKVVKKDSSLSRTVFDAANRYLDAEGFTGNTDDYYSPENSYINRVLETKLGIPISLSLMYACVLARLGIHCQPINFPRHFLLR